MNGRKCDLYKPGVSSGFCAHYPDPGLRETLLDLRPPFPFPGRPKSAQQLRGFPEGERPRPAVRFGVISSVLCPFPFRHLSWGPETPRPRPAGSHQPAWNGFRVHPRPAPATHAHLSAAHAQRGPGASGLPAPRGARPVRRRGGRCECVCAGEKMAAAGVAA